MTINLTDSKEVAGEGMEVLFKANTLIKSNVSITSNEYKMFNKILHKCQTTKENENQMLAVLTLEELKQIVKMKKEATPKALLSTLETFMKIPIRFELEKSYVSTTLINTVKVDKDTLNYNCYLNKDLFNVLMGYKEIGYSPIDLKLVRNANGYYTQRFYELFRMWSGTKTEVTYTIKDLKEWLMIEEGTSYDLYANFKNKIIKPSIKEISEKLNMQVDYTENKVGRKITSITFSVIDNEPRTYRFEDMQNIKPVFKPEKEIKKKAPVKEEIKSNFDLKIESFTLNEELRNTIRTFIKSRFANNKPLNDETLQLLLEKLRSIAITSDDMIKILKNSIIAGYPDIYPLKEEVKTKADPKSKDLKFANFTQRDYDYDSLEKQLLGWDNE